MIKRSASLQLRQYRAAFAPLLLQLFCFTDFSKAHEAETTVFLQFYYLLLCGGVLTAEAIFIVFRLTPLLGG